MLEHIRHRFESLLFLSINGKRKEKKKKRDTIKSYELKFHNLSKINSIHRE